MGREKIIIDTDPGVDDILAISLALNQPEKLEVLAFTLTHGNVGVESCLKNLVALFAVLEKENSFREKNGLKVKDFGKPIVAIGAAKPLLKEHAHGEPDFTQVWEGFHGIDGLNGVHQKMPNLITQDYLGAFGRYPTPPSQQEAFSNFTPSPVPAYQEILNQLQMHEAKTITIVVIGPCTNIALAAAADPITFARAKRILIMGGAVRVPGNQTPRAEFNIYADPDAAAQIFNLTQIGKAKTTEGQMDVALVPVDVTSSHFLSEAVWKDFSSDMVSKGSPLAIFLDTVLERTYEKMQDLIGIRVFGCHDPLTIYSMLEPDTVEFEHGLDIRVETDGIWTRGETVLDQRGVVKWTEGQKAIVRDNGGWFDGDFRNRISVLKNSGIPGEEFGLKMLEGIFQ